MERTITLKANTQTTRFLLILFAALCHFIECLLRPLLKTGIRFFEKTQGNDLTLPEMLLLMIAGIFLSQLLSLFA